MDETKKDPQTEEFLNQKSEANSFEANLMKIQEAAADLVRIQEVFKQQGKLSTEQRKLYSQSLENLGISAQKLAKIEGTDDNVRLLLEEPQGDRKKSKDSKKKPENIQFPPFYQLNKKDEDCEEGVVLEEGETNSTLTTTVEPSTTVKPITTSSSPPVTSSSTTTTKKPSITIIQGTNTATVQSNNNDVEEETSVAEAKPVGVAISGVGGVASSKPVGTAVVGPGGLAIARPQATAIAGIKPSDYSSLGLPLPTKLKNLNARDSTSLPSKGKYGLVNIGTDDDQTQFLVGPEFLAEARLSDKGIDSDGEEEFDTEDKVENEDSKTMEGENSRRQSTIEKEKDDVNELDSNKHTESSDNLQFPFGIEYGKHPQFPPAYDNFFAYQSPYFLPPNAYVPVPINNQYLQRGASNAVLRYPSYSGYSQFPGYSNNNGLQVSPFRLFYAQ
ncbi:hypothetical protein ACKWTF_002871 [Chironomus riparius]